MKKIKPFLVVLLLAGYVTIVSLWWMIAPAKEISSSERRRLSQRPPLTLQTLSSGFFMTRFEAYLKDQFPLRESMRHLKAMVVSGLFHQIDHHGIYFHNGVAGQLETPLDESRIQRTAGTFRHLVENQLQKSQGRIWFALIPDKSQYLAPSAGVPIENHAALLSLLREELPSMKVLDLKDQLSLDHFYRTDPHWRQETLPQLAAFLAKQMDTAVSGRYERIVSESPFSGAYQGQSALSMEPDTLCYLTNEVLSKVTVYDHEASRRISLYDPAAADALDPYSLFLAGPKPLLTLENPSGPKGRELLLFRDSFGSSLAPLLIEGYARITVVDLRYIAPSNLNQLITFNGQDVLFLYSAQVLKDGNFLQ